MSGPRSWSCKMLREASYLLRLFRYTCWRNFGTISGTPSFDLDFDLEGQMSGQGSWSCKLLREAIYPLRPFWETCWRNFVTISGSPSPAWNLTWKVKCQVKGIDRVSCWGRLAIVSDHFGTLVEVISVRYPVLRPFTLNLTWKVKCQVKSIGCQV